tara:strand:+ start:2032 stop:2529 length:498 start_codon:yes stop_codon:yes gene_type:complete
MKIMYVVQYYMNGWTEFDVAMPDIVYIDWQLRLLNYLSERGHEILVKQHPNSEINMPDYFFEDIGVKDIPGRFEDVYKKADIILTDYSGSTTFGTALKSNKPVILVDFGYSILRPEEEYTLKKACYVIEGKFLEDNRADIDWEDLKRALDECYAQNDRVYINETL